MNINQKEIKIAEAILNELFFQITFIFVYSDKINLKTKGKYDTSKINDFRTAVKYVYGLRLNTDVLEYISEKQINNLLDKGFINEEMANQKVFLISSTKNLAVSK